MMSVARVARLGLIVAAALMSMPMRADAHTDVVGTTPEAGSVLASTPAAISVTFSEPVSTDLAMVAIVDGRGDASRAAVEQLDATTLQVRPSAAAEPGRWTVSYRVVSRDGHPVQGSFAFRVRSEQSGPTASNATSPTDVPGSPNPSGNDSDSGPVGAPDSSEPTTADRISAGDRWLSTVVIGLITLFGVVLTLWLIARAGTRPRA
jgi:copper resistance protein C